MKIKKWLLKSVSMLLSIALLLNGVSVMFIPAVYSDSEDPGYRIYEFNMFATETVNGVTAEKELKDMVTPLTKDTKVRIEAKWRVDNDIQVAEGTTMTMKIPDIFDLGDFDLSGNLLGGGSDYGDYLVDVSERDLILTMGALPGTQSNVEGTVELFLDLRVESLGVDLPYEVITKYKEKIISEFDLRYSIDGGVDIVKDYDDKDGTDDNITSLTEHNWVVDINTKMETIDNPVIVDTFATNTKYKKNDDGTDSVEIIELSINSDGTITETANVFNDYSLSDNGTDITITFNNPTSKAYRVVYKTEIIKENLDINQNQFVFTNTATFNGESDDETITYNVPEILDKTSSLSSVYNAESVDWDVEVNKSNYVLPNVVVTDTVPDGLVISDLTVKKISDGTIYADVVTDVTGQVITATFNGALTIPVIIEYKTTIDPAKKIDNNSNVKFDNSATMTYGDTSQYTKTATTKATVNKGKVVTKYGNAVIGYNGEKFINWTVDINTLGLDLGTNIFTDTLGAHQKLNGGVTINELTVDNTKTSNNLTVGAVSNPTITTTLKVGNSDGLENGDIIGFGLYFGGNIDKAYRIQYQTIIVENGYDQSQFTNKGTIGTHNANATVNTTIQNTFNKTNTSIDYSTGIMGWKITFDPREYGMSNFKVVDDFGTDHYMTKDDSADAVLDQWANLVVKKSGVVMTLGAGNDYTITETLTDGKISGFTIDFVNEVNNGNYEITYNTTINPDEVNAGLDYGNEVVFSWNNGSEESLSKDAYPSNNSKRDNNGQKSGTLDEANKKISWEIDTNFLAKNLNNHVVEDTIPANLRLDGSTIKIYHATVAADGTITKGALADLTGFNVSYDNAANTFRIEFPPLIKLPYHIEFDTNFEGISLKEYTNTATAGPETLTATVEHPNGTNFIEKSGSLQSQDSIEWTINLNKSRSTVTSMKMTDTMSEGLSLDIDSFKLYDKDNVELVFADYFTVTILDRDLLTDPQEFELSSKQTITDKMKVKYTTTIIVDEVIGKKVTNDLTFEGENVTTVDDPGQTALTLNFISGSGTGTGEVGNFTLTKVDEDDPTIKLQGAVFNFYKSDRLLGTLTTDENGQISVGNLRYAEYKLEEITAPAGYAISGVAQTFTLNNTTTKDITFTNKRIRSIEIKKVHEGSDIGLQGAEFNILDAGDNVIATAVSDANGIARATVDPGTYKIVETKAPNYYYLDSTPVEVIVDTSKILFEVKMENKRMPTPDPEPTPEPEPEPEPEVEPEPTPEPDPEPVEEKTDNSTPKEVPLDIPETSKPTVTTPPKNGTVTEDPDGTWTYIPDEDFVGDDTFEITVEHEDGSEEIIYFEFEVEETPQGAFELPQTGDAIPWNNYLLGSLSIFLGFALMFINRKYL